MQNAVCKSSPVTVMLSLRGSSHKSVHFIYLSLFCDDYKMKVVNHTVSNPSTTPKAAIAQT